MTNHNAQVETPQFTPKPWRLETVSTQVGHCHKIGPFPSATSARKETYACVYVDGLGLKPEDAPELLANARLMRAAPDLYEALKATPCRVSRVTECRYGDPEMCDRCAALALVEESK